METKSVKSRCRNRFWNIIQTYFCDICSDSEKLQFLDSDKVITVRHPDFITPIAQLPKQQSYEPSQLAVMRIYRLRTFPCGQSEEE